MRIMTERVYPVIYRRTLRCSCPV